MTATARGRSPTEHDAPPGSYLPDVARTAAMNWAIFFGLFVPGPVSTPPETSNIDGETLNRPTVGDLLDADDARPTNPPVDEPSTSPDLPPAADLGGGALPQPG